MTNFTGFFHSTIPHASTLITRLLRRTGASISRSKVLASDVRSELKKEFVVVLQAFDREDMPDMENATRRISILIRDGLKVTGQRPFEVLSVFLVILAVEDFLRNDSRADLGAGGEVFLAVCLKRVGELVYHLED